MQMDSKRRKNTAYFLRLEERNFSKTLIRYLKVDDQIINDPKDILNAGKK